MEQWFLTHFDKSMIDYKQNFVLYSYVASHGLLLLRSRRTKLEVKRIDILFQDVRAMDIRAWFDGLIVNEISPELLNGYPSNPSVMIEPGNKVYQLTGLNWTGYVVAGAVSVSEDEGDFTAPSQLLERT